MDPKKEAVIHARLTSKKLPFVDNIFWFVFLIKNKNKSEVISIITMVI